MKVIIESADGNLRSEIECPVVVTSTEADFNLAVNRVVNEVLCVARGERKAAELEAWRQEEIARDDEESGGTIFEPQPYIGVGPRYNVRREVKS